MDDRARRVEALFQEALDRPEAERAGFLAEAAGHDSILIEEVQALLRHHTQATEGFLDRPPVRLADPGRRVTDPETVGPYRIHHRLGEGGFGVVYEAEQTEPIRRRVALKVIKAGMDSEAVLARFEAERQALALMDHSNIARVLDAGTTEEGRPYFVMELVRGDPITDYCDRHRLDLRERLRLFQTVCYAVQHAHQKGVIHRDLKPSNLLVTLEDGKPVPKVIDFGIAKAVAAPLTDRALPTIQGQLMGTPAYMSPEQAERTGLDVDTTTDIYSLGVVLYELMSGFIPFDPAAFADAHPEDIRKVLREEEPAVPSARFTRVSDQAVALARSRDTEPWALVRQLRGDLDWIVARAMEKDRTRRYQTALELAREIERHLQNEPVLAGPPGVRYRLRKFVRRHRVAISVGAAIGGGLLVAAGALTFALVESNRQKDRARSAQSESEAVTAFLSDMLLAVSPGQEGREVTVKSVLDQAAPEIEETFHEQPRVRSSLHHTVGRAYHELGEYELAEEHLLAAAALRREALGDGDPQTLESLRELGIVYSGEGKFEDSESTLVGVLTARRLFFPPGSIEVIHSLNDLGGLYLLMEQNARGLPLLEEAFALARENLGPDESLTRNIAGNLAVALRGVGRYDEVEPLMVDALEQDRRLLGSRHPETLESMQNLGGFYREMDRFDEALALYLESVETAREVLGEEHPSTVRYLHNLALLYSDMGRYDEARPLSEEVTRLRREAAGDEHPSTIASCLNLALLYRRMGEFDACQDLLLKTIPISRRAMGEEHLYTLVLEGTLGNLYLAMDRAAEAERILGRTIEKARTALPGNYRTGVFLVRYAGALMAQEKFADAEAAALEGHEIVAASLPPEHERVQTAVQQLVDLYEAWGRPEEAARWRTHLIPGDS